MMLPSFMDCLPPFREFSGLLPQANSPSFNPSTVDASTRPPPINRGTSPNAATWLSLYPQFSPREDEIAIPSTMPPTTKQEDLPITPPPFVFWKLKKLDPSASVMDYWVKSDESWDIKGIESDIKLSLKSTTSNNSSNRSK